VSVAAPQPPLGAAPPRQGKVAPAPPPGPPTMATTGAATAGGEANWLNPFQVPATAPAPHSSTLAPSPSEQQPWAAMMGGGIPGGGVPRGGIPRWEMVSPMLQDPGQQKGIGMRYENAAARCLSPSAG